MIKKNIKKCALFCLTAVLACSVGLLLTIPKYSARGEKVSLAIENVQDTNRLGTTVNLPNEIEVIYKGAKVLATNGCITYPDGKTYGTGSYVLNDAGKYSVKYYFKDGDQIITAERVFEISNSFFALSTTAGSITAVTEEQCEGKILDTNDQNISVNGKDALIVRLNDGCKFIYNEPIDLTNGGAGGIADIISLNYRLGEIELNDDPSKWQDWMYYREMKSVNGKNQWVYREENGQRVLNQENYFYRYVSDIADHCKITLTDAYNPEIQVVLDENKGFMDPSPTDNNYGQNYSLALSAGASGQPLIGCRPGSDSTGWKVLSVAEIEGKNYMARQEWRLATTPSETYLTSRGAGNLKDGVTWGYDNEKQIVYIKDHTGQYNVVSELDNEAIYGKSVFGGFTTGEVFLTIEFTGYSAPKSARIDILGINGRSGDELIDLYNGDKTGTNGSVDTVAPVIEVQYEETNKDTIYVPYGSEVEIPSVFIREVFPVGGYNVNVYTNYTKSSKKLVSVKNGKFTANEHTVYTIEYTAKDTSGLEGKAIVNVIPRNTEGGKGIWVETEKLTKAEAGDTIVLPEYQVKTINKQEACKVQIKAIHDKETVIIDTEDRIFRPLYSGTYKIVYELSDNVSNETSEYEVNVSSSSEKKFLSAPFLPRYMIKGDTYSLEALNAYEFSSGEGKAVKADAYVSEDGGEFKKVSNVKAYKVKANSTLAIYYKAGDAVSSTTQAKVISNTISKVISGKEREIFRVYKYFVGNYTIDDEFNAAGRPITSVVEYQLGANKGSTSLEFANIVNYEDFVFQFKTGENANYGALKVVLTDVYNAKNKVEIKFTKGTTGYEVDVDGASKYINDTFASIDTKEVKYDKYKKVFKVQGGEFAYEFDFTSSLCYLDVEFENITGKTTFIVEKVGNHPFRGNKTKDDIIPNISVYSSDGNYTLGTVLKLDAPVFTDVISQIDHSKDSFTVTHESGQVITFENPLEAQELVLDKIGRYNLAYRAFDYEGNSTLYTYIVNVIDDVAPVITVNGYKDNTMILVKRGQILELDYSYSDDTTATENIFITVAVEDLSTGMATFIKEDKTHVPFPTEGDYAIKIIAKDEAYNTSYKTIYVRVEGGK